MTLKGKIASYAMSVATGFLMCLVLVTQDQEVTVVKGDREVTVTRDTIYVKQPPVTITKKMVVKQPYAVTVIDTVYVVDKQLSYRDTVEVQKDVKISYDAKITGRLDDISLSYMDTRPIRTITEVKTETITNTVVKRPGGLYIGGTTDLSLNTSVGGMYVKGRNAVGISTKLNQSSFSDPNKYNLTYYRRLF